MRMCVVKLKASENRLPQLSNGQAKGRSPLWTNACRFSFNKIFRNILINFFKNLSMLSKDLVADVARVGPFMSINMIVQRDL